MSNSLEEEEDGSVSWCHRIPLGNGLVTPGLDAIQERVLQRRCELKSHANQNYRLTRRSILTAIVLAPAIDLQKSHAIVAMSSYPVTYKFVDGWFVSSAEENHLGST